MSRAHTNTPRSTLTRACTCAFYPLTSIAAAVADPDFDPVSALQHGGHGDHWRCYPTSVRRRKDQGRLPRRGPVWLCLRADGADHDSATALRCVRVVGGWMGVVEDKLSMPQVHRCACVCVCVTPLATCTLSLVSCVVCYAPIKAPRSWLPRPKSWRTPGH